MCFVTRHIYKHVSFASDQEIKRDFPELRQTAKSAGFAIQYGGTGYTIAKNLGISQTRGDFVYDSYFKAFPKLKDYFEKTKALAVKRNFIILDNITGRKTWFPKGTPKNRIERASLNFPIQGEAGSITKLAAIIFRSELLKHNLQDLAYSTNLIHDEINVEVSSKSIQYDVAKLLQESMEKAGEIWCKKVKLKAKAVIGDYWGH